MKFWDASAIVPLLVAETTTRRLQALARRDPDMLAWWGRQWSASGPDPPRTRRHSNERRGARFQRSKQLATGGMRSNPMSRPRKRGKVLRVHPLQAADALQLAAALVAAQRRPATLEVVTLDDRLAEAARKEGFELIDVIAD